MEDPVFDFAYATSLLPALSQGFLLTLWATLLGTCIALALGLLFAMGRRSSMAWLAWPTSLLIEFVRSTPLLVQLYFLFFALPSAGLAMSPLATGVLGLGVHYATYTSEVYRAGIEAIPHGQWDAAAALGFSRSHTLFAIIFPQAIPPMLPALGNYAIAMFKDTPLLSAITVIEIVQVAQIEGARSFRYLEAFSLVGLFFLLSSLMASACVSAMEERFAARVA